MDQWWARRHCQHTHSLSLPLSVLSNVLWCPQHRVRHSAPSLSVSSQRRVVGTAETHYRRHRRQHSATTRLTSPSPPHRERDKTPHGDQQLFYLSLFWFFFFFFFSLSLTPWPVPSHLLPTIHLHHHQTKHRLTTGQYRAHQLSHPLIT